MSIVEIRQKLHDYIEAAPDKKIEAIYTMVEEEIEEPYDHWEDEEFVGQLLKGEQQYLNGTMRTYTLEESISGAREAIKDSK